MCNCRLQPPPQQYKYPAILSCSKPTRPTSTRKFQTRKYHNCPITVRRGKTSKPFCCCNRVRSLPPEPARLIRRRAIRSEPLPYFRTVFHRRLITQELTAR